jgi:two-component sensor histidine kinase
MVEKEIVLRWTEHGGQKIDGPPASVDFGTQLVARTVQESLSGSVSSDLKPGGLEVTLLLPLDSLAR